MTAALIDRLPCPFCGRSRVADVTTTGEVTYRRCLCLPDGPQTRAEVDLRHRAAVHLARHRADWLARHAARSRA